MTPEQHADGLLASWVINPDHTHESRKADIAARIREAVHAYAAEREAGNAELVKRLAVLAEHCPYCRAALMMYRMAPAPNLAAALVEVVEVLVGQNRDLTARVAQRERTRVGPVGLVTLPNGLNVVREADALTTRITLRVDAPEAGG